MTTEVLAPWVWVLGIPFAVAAAATHSAGATLLWGLVVGITGSVIPMAVVLRGVRKGKWDNHHVTTREQRLIPFLVCIGSVGSGWTILALGGAPQQMLALAISMFVSLVVTLGITFGLSWKVSMHSAVSAGAVTVLVVTFGPVFLVAAVLVLLIAWSRVVLGDHTVDQVIGGVFVGVCVGGLLFWFLSTV